MENKEFRTRQAPSPTGYLHLGTARQMLFTTLFAKINKGNWYIRIEDTDRSRLEQNAVTNLIDTLEPLGLLPNEGVVATEKTITDKSKLLKDNFYGVYQSGKFGPYIQSERLDTYYKYAQELIDKKLAYWSYLTPEDKQEIQQEKQLTKKTINYFKENIKRSDKFSDSQSSWEELQKEAEKDTDHLFKSVDDGLSDQSKPALMYRIQRDDSIDCRDELLGKTNFDLSLEEDFVILKSDGFPTYHLAHLVDDYLMKTTLVIRAQEWYPSLARHTVMFLDLWGIVPKYIHLPVILGETGNRKLSKRDGNVNMGEYLKMGYLPEAIVNYLAFLGWNPGTEKELYLGSKDFQDLNRTQRIEKLIDNIAKEFNIEKLSKSSARFSLKKLDWFNREYIKMMSLDEFATITKSIQDYQFSKLNATAETIRLAMILDKYRITTLSEIGLDSDCILKYTKIKKNELKWRKIELKESLQNLKEISGFISDEYDSLQDDQKELLASAFEKGAEEKFNQLSKKWEEKIKSWLTENNYDTGSYLWPLRVSLSGKTKSPSPFEILSIIDKEEFQSRINNYF